MRLASSDWRDDTQSDLSHKRAFFRRLDNGNRGWDHGGVFAVELRASEKTFGVGHVLILTSAMQGCSSRKPNLTSLLDSLHNDGFALIFNPSACRLVNCQIGMIRIGIRI